jgi:hypothetical protein
METIIFNSIRDVDTGFITSISFCFTLTDEGKTVYTNPLSVAFENVPEDMVAFDSVTETMISEWIAAEFEEGALARINAELQFKIDNELPSEVHGLPY